MAFSARYKELFLPIPDSWLHDAWIALIVTVYAHLAIIDQPLIKYRQHLNQQLGAIKKGFIKQMTVLKKTKSNIYFTQLNRYILAQSLLANNYSTTPCNKEVFLMLEAKMDHLIIRGNMPKQKLRRLIVIIKELAALRYHRYSYGWKSAARDLFFN
ncbi:MAG: hypothetical protein A4E53_03776 [Pelotomaculum sp. PtaB.Bin104]|nr:MAG: hypothetical protein A4E53_03776 [Pelotomaculum sp. PtaB.Bin104]